MVDDEAAIREITRSTLEAAGYRVLTASDGTEAVVLFVQHKNDVKAVITDLVMPYMDGPATIRALRKLNPLARIIVSTGVSDKNRTDVVDAGVDAVLSKPYTADTLLKTLTDVLCVPRNDKSLRERPARPHASRSSGLSYTGSPIAKRDSHETTS